MTAIVLLCGGRIHAADYTWDASGGSPLNDGAGSWNASGGSTWFNASSYGAWGNTSVDNAVFGVGSGAAGTITVGAVTTNAITFNAAGSGTYTLSSGTISLAGTAPTITSNVDATIASLLSGSLGLTKTGAGTLTLSNTNSFTGGTTVNAGKLVLSGSYVIRGALTINQNGTVDASAANWSLGFQSPAVVSSISINGGTLNFTDSSNLAGLAASSITMTGGSITGGGFTWYRGLTYTPTLVTTSTSTTAVISAPLFLRLGTSGSVGTLTFDVAAGTAPGGVDLAVSGSITNSPNTYTDAGGNILKKGAGLMQLSGTNTFSGQLTVEAGTLAIATINNASANGTLGNSAKAVILGASGGGVGTLRYTGSDATPSSTKGFTMAAGGTGAFQIDNAATNLTLSGLIDGSGGLTKSGPGTLTLSNTNTYSGGTTLNGGKLALPGATAIRGDLTINAGATVDASAAKWSLGYVSSTTAVANIAINGGTLNFTDSDTAAGIVASRISMAGGSITGGGFTWFGKDAQNGITNTPTLATTATTTTATISAPIYLRLSSTGAITFDVAAGTVPGGVDLAVSGAIAPAVAVQGNVGGRLIKTGAGTMVLSGSNSYTGSTTVSLGTLRFAGPASLYSSLSGSWTAANITTGSGATLAFNVGGSNEFTQGNISTLLTNLASSTSAANGMNAGSSLGFDTSNASGGTFTINDAIADTTGASGGARGLVKLGAGTLVLGGSNAFSGATSINAGTISFASKNAFAATCGISIASGAGLTYTGTADAFGRNITVSSGTGTVTNSGGLLTLGGTLTKNGTVLRLRGGSSGIKVTGTITGASPSSDLAVQNGLTTLSAANSYTGPTFINSSGTLALGVNNAIPSNSAVTIGGSDAGGDGGPGRFSMGSFTNQIGSLSFSGSGGTIAMALTSSATSTLVLSATGAVNLNGTSTLDLTEMATGAGLYKLLAGSSLSGTFASVTGLDSNYLLRYGSVNANEVDAQRRADQDATFTITTGTVMRALVNSSVTVSGTVSNSSPANSTALALGLASTGLTGSGFTTGSVAAGSGLAVSGILNAGSNVGTQNWTVTNTDNSAITTLSTATGSLQVVNQRSFSLSSGTLSLGSFLLTAAVTGSTTISSSGAYATTASAALGGFSGTNTNGFSLGTTDATAFNGGGPGLQSANYRVSGSASSAGAIAGSFTSTVAAELGEIAPITVILTGTAYDAASVSQSQSAAGSGGTISITNAAGTYRSAAYVASTSLTGHQGWSVTGFGTGDSAAAGATLAGTAHFNAAGLLSGTYTGVFTAALQNDRNLTGAAANDLGSLSWNLSEVVLNTTGTGSAALAANGALNTVSLFSGSGAGATLASFAAGQIGGSPSEVIMSFTSGSTGQYSDILHLQGTDGLAQVLQLTYDPSLLGSTKETSLILGWLDTRTDSPTKGQWINSVLGNSATNGVTMQSPFLGSWASYVTVTGKTVDAALGAYGVDATTHTVWAAINHNSQFVVIVPEPDTIIFAGIGIAMAGWSLWRRRRIARIVRR